MEDRRARNAKIFRDTERMYKSNEILKEAIKKAYVSQIVVMGRDCFTCEPSYEREGKVVVSGKRTLEAAEPYVKPGKRVCVLNFASATNPGGGVIHGSSAQEESICRCSTLYPCLNIQEMWECFYEPHRYADNSLYNDDCIFTPDVKVFKSDTNFPELLPESEWWDVDVITCAAPNLRSVPSNRMNPHSGSKRAEVTYDELRELHRSRIKRIFEVAIANKAEVLVLGAFGCGAFRNPPELVAEVFREYTEKYRKCFDVIEYAVFHTKRETTNYEVFVEAMKGM